MSGVPTVACLTPGTYSHVFPGFGTSTVTSVKEQALFRIARHTGRHRTRHAALALATVMVVSGCGALGMDTSKASSGSGGLEKSTLKVSILPPPALGRFWRAQDEAFFKEEGLTVESVVAAGGQASRAKSIWGEPDIAFSPYPPFFTAKST